MKQKLLLTFALLLTAVTGAWALEPRSGDDWNESTKTLTVNSNPVVGAYYYKTEIEHVVISAGVTTIGKSAFSGCTNLASVTFDTGSQLTTIGEEAFGRCKLTSVTIPDGVTTIGNGAFMSCSNLTSVTFGSGVETIGASAFDGTGLTSITIPASVTSIGNGVLTGCSNLATITVATGNTHYDSRNSCNAIIDKSNNTLLAGCKSTIIPDDVTTIDDRVFWGCSGLTSIEIPASVTNIGFSAFANCTNLASVTFATGSQLETISEQAFIRCSGLTSIEIPANVETIGNMAFQECTNLASVTFASGSKLTSIGEQAFNACTGLTSIAIPAGVTSIGDRAFANCSNLASVTLNSNPYIGENAFPAGASVTMNLTGNEGATGEYWMTFYNKNCNFSVPSTTKIFKAALSGSTLTLTELTTDMRVNQDNAVILKSTSANITLVYQTIGGSNDFSGNQLQGVSDPEGLVSDGTTYVLNKTAAKGVGFYKLQAGSKLGVGKAYLTYSGGGSSNFFSFEEETTSLKSIDNGQLTIDNYYNLSGCRVMNPTKGLYIVNGKKVVIK